MRRGVRGCVVFSNALCGGKGTVIVTHMFKCFAALLLAANLLSAGAKSDWKQLFNGKNLDGWKHVGKGEMTVEDGLIQTHGGMGLLYWTETKLGDCMIRVVFMTLGTVCSRIAYG